MGTFHKRTGSDEKFYNILFDSGGADGGSVSSVRFSFGSNQKLREVPFYTAAEKTSRKFFLEVGENRMSVFSVDLCFPGKLKGHSEIASAHGGHCCIGFRFLIEKLAAGKPDYTEPSVFEGLVESFELSELRRQSASGCRIDHQDCLSPVCAHADWRT